MSLWGNSDAVVGLATARYTVASSAASNGTITVTGTGSSFGLTGAAGVGDVIRFGADARGRSINVGSGHTYFGDAVIVAVASSESITIGSSAGLSQIGFTTSARFSQLPKSTVLDPQLSQKRTDADNTVYGISTTSSSTYSATHEGWGGVTTYVDNHGTLRVKNEVLVAMSGITTTASTIGQTPSIPYPNTCLL